jgi:hypothetical protein
MINEEPTTIPEEEEPTTPIPATEPPLQLLTYDELDESPEVLQKKRIQIAELTGKKGLLIKERTAQLIGTWWENLSQDLLSDDPVTRRWAMSEFNKIQIKQIPTTLANDEENPITPVLNKDERERVTNTIGAIIGFIGGQS